MTKPLSREFLLQRGYCCGCSCLNCPYEPKNERGSREISLFPLAKTVQLNCMLNKK